VPSVLERLYLGVALLAGFRRTEQHVVCCIAVERWIEVDEVDGVVLERAEDAEVVAVVELI
jgi:hypothetical protein